MRSILKYPCGLGLFRLERRAGLESYDLARLDLDLFAGSRIEAGASLAFNNGERAEADELELLVLLNARLDGFDSRVESFFSAGFRGVFAENFLNFFDELLFVHIFFCLWFEIKVYRINVEILPNIKRPALSKLRKKAFAFLSGLSSNLNPLTPPNVGIHFYKST